MFWKLKPKHQAHGNLYPGWLTEIFHLKSFHTYSTMAWRIMLFSPNQPIPTKVVWLKPSKSENGSHRQHLDFKHDGICNHQLCRFMFFVLIMYFVNSVTFKKNRSNLRSTDMTFLFNQWERCNN